MDLRFSLLEIESWHCCVCICTPDILCPLDPFPIIPQTILGLFKMDPFCNPEAHCQGRCWAKKAWTQLQCISAQQWCWPFSNHRWKLSGRRVWSNGEGVQRKSRGEKNREKGWTRKLGEMKGKESGARSGEVWESRLFALLDGTLEARAGLSLLPSFFQRCNRGGGSMKIWQYHHNFYCVGCVCEWTCGTW